MNKQEFDKLFDEAFEKAVKNLPDSHLPDYRPSWEKVKKKLAEMEKKKTMDKSIRNFSVY